MLTGFIASLAIGGLGGYLLGRRRGRDALPNQAKLPPPRLVEGSAAPTVEEEISCAMRQGPPLTIIYLAWVRNEADDATFRLIESLLARLVRPYDTIVPLGEGGFALVLPQVGEAAADSVASRLIQDLALLTSVQLRSSETLLPRISLHAPVNVKRLLDAAREAAELGPPWRGDRGLSLKLGMAVMERPQFCLLGPLAPGVILRLQSAPCGDPPRIPAAGSEPFRTSAYACRSSSELSVTRLDEAGLHGKLLDPFSPPLGAVCQIIREEGQAWLRAEAEVRFVAGGELGVRLPSMVYRLPRRQAERFRMRLPVQLADLEGFTLNVSAEGFRAVFPLRVFSPGQVLDGMLTLPEGRQPIRAEVIKVRSADDAEGMIVGCRFATVDASVQLALTRLLSQPPGIG